MSAKNIQGPNGKKPASAATNLIGMSNLLRFLRSDSEARANGKSQLEGQQV
jgi:hypothetical protein